MCVIFIHETHRPTEEQVERAFTTNPSGGGVAWREGGFVKWDKGLALPAMQTYAKDLPFPFVLHFRIPTCGGTRPSLCHPFPINKDAPLDLVGKTKGYVLFHNGHWNAWKETMKDAIFRHHIQTPGGKWSDTRAMAWAAANFGLFTLDFLDEKILAFGPSDIETFGRGWEEIDKGGNSFWASNKHWEFTRGSTTFYGHAGDTTNRGVTTYRNHSVCRFGTCKENKFSTYEYCSEHLTHDKQYRDDIERGEKENERKAGGTSDQATFRQGDSNVQGGKPQPQTAQEAAEAVRKAGEGEENAGRQNLSTLADLVWARTFNPKQRHGSPRLPPGPDPDIIKIH